MHLFIPSAFIIFASLTTSLHVNFMKSEIHDSLNYYLINEAY